MKAFTLRVRLSLKRESVIKIEKETETSTLTMSCMHKMGKTVSLKVEHLSCDKLPPLVYHPWPNLRQNFLAFRTTHIKSKSKWIQWKHVKHVH